MPLKKKTMYSILTKIIDAQLHNHTLITSMLCTINIVQGSTLHDQEEHSNVVSVMQNRLPVLWVTWMGLNPAVRNFSNLVVRARVRDARV